MKYHGSIFHAAIIINMDESFTLYEIEQSEIEQATETPNIDNITVCSCSGICLRERGRNACPCKTISQYCSAACHPCRTICMNKEHVLGDNSSESEEDDQEIATVSVICDLLYQLCYDELE